jgi:hypothetical protein
VILAPSLEREVVLVVTAVSIDFSVIDFFFPNIDHLITFSFLIS